MKENNGEKLLGYDDKFPYRPPFFLLFSCDCPSLCGHLLAIQDKFA